MNNYVHGGAAAPVKTKRVFLRAGTAHEGYAVNYNWDEVANQTEGDSVTSTRAALTAAGWNDARRTQVEVPTFQNNMHFAGVVDAASDGVVGPNWITIHEPGSICNIYTGAAVSVGVGGDDGNQGTTRTFTIASTTADLTMGDTNGQFIYSGLPGKGTATLLAEGAASAPNDSYLKMAELQDGMPSGGVQTYTLISTNMTMSCCIHHGVIALGAGTLTIESTTGTLSVTAGDFIGQTLIVRGPATAVSHVYAVNVLTAVVVVASLESWAGTDNALVVANATLTTNTSFARCEWQGDIWTVIARGKLT